jgi:hypothetical protein
MTIAAQEQLVTTRGRLENPYCSGRKTLAMNQVLESSSDIKT